MFQFHFGTIRSSAAFFASCFFFCFNSTLVRLEDDLVSRSSITFKSFNSTLVRLEAKIKKMSLVNEQVSIPLWYD